MAEATIEAVWDKSPRPCENCGEGAEHLFYKDCAKCSTEMLVCSDCLQEWVETAHENCEQ